MNKIIDVVIIGAGIVGLATAYKLLKKHPRLAVTLLEKEGKVAAHQTGHNSGVIHSGIYYKPGSLKAKTCIDGVRQMKAFCEKEDIPLQKCGKVIVATETSELERLEELYRRGAANSVPGIALIGPERLKELEPGIVGIKALHSPQTTILDYKNVSLVLKRLLESMGAVFHFNNPCTSIHSRGGSIVTTAGGNGHESRFLINCGGAWCDDLARLAGCNVPERIIPFRGEYYMLTPKKGAEVRGLVYPVPDPNLPFLGVHITRMIDGGVEAGPNAVLALAKDGYTKSKINASFCRRLMAFPGFWKMVSRYWKVGVYETYRSYSKQAFLRSLRKFMPSLELNDLQPGGAGVRAQLVRPDGSLCDDFCIRQAPRMIHVLNAPSPAATASFAIADHLVDLSNEAFFSK